jgi:citrate lyase subunit beta/citryl-CoA lyase
VLPKCRGGDDVRLVGHYLTALEAKAGVTGRRIAVLPIVTESGTAMFGLGSYGIAPIPRLCGMLWGGEDLAADLGASANRGEDGRYTAAIPSSRARFVCSRQRPPR